MADTKKIVLDLFDKLVFDQDDIKNTLGGSFSSVLRDTVELIKDNALSNHKYDYDSIYEQLNEKADEIPGLKSILTELKKRHTT